MEPTPMISATLEWLVFISTLVLFIVWIIRRRKKLKEEIKNNRLAKKPYNTSQIFAIIGILVFLVPIFWVIGVMLQKGLIFLFILFFGWISSPTIIIVLKTIFLISTLFLLFTGVYLVCELVWPNRYVSERKSVDSESVEPKKR